MEQSLNLSTTVRRGIARAVAIAALVTLIAVLAAIAFGQPLPAQPNNEPVHATVLAGGVDAADHSSADTFAPTRPLLVLVDTSSSAGKLPVQTTLRERLTQLLRASPPGRRRIYTFSTSAHELLTGKEPAINALDALLALDHVNWRGQTDLGAALSAVKKEAGSSEIDTVILSDFQLDPPTASPFHGVPLTEILNGAHRDGAKRVLLLPIGDTEESTLNGLPAFVTVARDPQAISTWARGLIVPPPTIIQSNPVRPFWTRASFIIAALVSVLMLLAALVYYRKKKIEARAAAEVALLTAAPAPLPEEEPPAANAPSMPAAPMRRWHFLILETGEDRCLTESLKIGGEYLADVFVDGAISTLEIHPGQNALHIANRGKVAVHLGKLGIPPGTAATLPAGLVADAILARDRTVRFYQLQEVVS